ncbi:MAG: hypothetical protein KZQ95_17850, partial [Candidatus Thiodiazotropha sp. (ex Epidulcina cf. delphinae)]|nr:hypothetical protein [Candidatus Thiodiazotropha sp. (ex Epidulcina cf. delphinae)]
GQRVKKVTADGTTIYHYDQNGKLIAETQADGTMQREYVWLDDQPIVQVEADGALHYLHADHLNTPRSATDSKRGQPSFSQPQKKPRQNKRGHSSFSLKKAPPRVEPGFLSQSSTKVSTKQPGMTRVLAGHPPKWAL